MFTSVLACVLMAATVGAAEPAPQPRGCYANATYGFALQPPAFDALPAGKVQDVVMFTGPAGDGFAPNVGLRIAQGQARLGVDDFAGASVAGLEKIGAKVLTQKTGKVEGRDTVRLEATGRISGRELHLLSYSVLDTDRIIVLTCTCTAAQWESLGPRYAACADSFRFAGDKPGAGYVDATYGFTLEPPAFDALPAGKAQAIALFHGSADAGFAPTLGIRIAQGQASGSVEDYAKSAVEGVTKMGCKVVAQKTGKVQGRDALRLEYAGTVSGRDLHFFSYSVFDADRTIIISATATETQFPAVRDRYTACLDSFRFTADKP
jgi:hypothetical protein